MSEEAECLRCIHHKNDRCEFPLPVWVWYELLNPFTGKPKANYLPTGYVHQTHCPTFKERNHA